MIRMTLPSIAALLALGLVAAPAAPAAASPPADARSPGALTPLDHLASQRTVDLTLIPVLREKGAAEVTIYFVQPSLDDPLYASHPARYSDVGPLLFDLVTMAESPAPRFEDLGTVRAFTARMGTAALERLSGNPYVLAIDRADGGPAAPSGGLGNITEASHGCTPSATAACLLSGRFRITITHGGNTSRVGASNNNSAVFWTFGSTNWEIVTKVLDGCSVNGHFWVFSAGATSISYTLSVEDTKTDLLNFYSNAPCPLASTTAFPCP